MIRRPGRTAVFGLLAAAGLLGVVTGAQPWWRVRAEGSELAFTGSDVTGGLSQALSVVLLIGTLLGLAVGVRGRQVLAVLLGLTATGLAVIGGRRQPPSEDAVRTRVRLVTLADQFTQVSTVWPWICLIAGVLGLLGAVLLGWSARSWPGRTSRFERSQPGARTARTEPSQVGAGIDPGADPAAVWRALDAGIDPTVGGNPALDEESGGGIGPAARDSPPADPDVRRRGSGDTMEFESGTQPDR